MNYSFSRSAEWIDQSKDPFTYELWTRFTETYQDIVHIWLFKKALHNKKLRVSCVEIFYMVCARADAMIGG